MLNAYLLHSCMFRGKSLKLWNCRRGSEGCRKSRWEWVEQGREGEALCAAGQWHVPVSFSFPHQLICIIPRLKLIKRVFNLLGFLLFFFFYLFTFSSFCLVVNLSNLDYFFGHKRKYFSMIVFIRKKINTI